MNKYMARKECGTLASIMNTIKSLQVGFFHESLYPFYIFIFSS